MLGSPDTAIPHWTMSEESGSRESRAYSLMKVWPWPWCVTRARLSPTPTTASLMNSMAGLLQLPPGGTTSPRKKDAARGWIYIVGK